MHKATELIEQALKSQNMKCAAYNLDVFSYVEAGFTGDNFTFQLRFISPDDDMDVKALTNNIAKAPAAKQAKVLVTLNKLNKTYKYAKFAMDDNGEITVEFDFPSSTTPELVGQFAFEIALRFARIVDDAYPEIMKAIYA